MISKPIPYGRQHITDEDIRAVIDTLKSDYLTQGPKIREFETKFAEYVGAQYAVAVNNATSGLHLAATALNVKPGDKVIVTPMTFAASANCIRYCGGEVVFCDIDKDTYLMDIRKLEAMLKASPRGTYKGIVPVDFAGYPLDLEEFRKLADEYGLWIIEDACHAPGGYFMDSKGKKQHCGNGRFADCAVFSFHPVKHIATGEGGMVTTNSKELYDKLCLYRTHGITKDPALLHEHHGGWYYEMQELGYNYRLTDFQAALGISQLERAKAGLERRHEIVRRYNEAFSGIDGIKTPFNTATAKFDESVWTIDQMRKANRESIYCDGVENITDATLVYTDELVAKVKKSFNVDLPKSVKFVDIENVADLIINQIIKPQVLIFVQ